jgi:acetylornithine deacetylase/succinyl-diaminopimelate desuccinylase-like protein
MYTTFNRIFPWSKNLGQKTLAAFLGTKNITAIPIKKYFMINCRVESQRESMRSRSMGTEEIKEHLEEYFPGRIFKRLYKVNGESNEG